MELAATLTIWALFSGFLIFPAAGLPPLWHRTAMALLVAELVALMLWSYGSEGCEARPCAPPAETGRTAAALDIPVLAGLLIVLAVARSFRRGPAPRDPGARRPRRRRRRPRRASPRPAAPP